VEAALFATDLLVGGLLFLFELGDLVVFLALQKVEEIVDVLLALEGLSAGHDGIDLRLVFFVLSYEAHPFVGVSFTVLLNLLGLFEVVHGELEVFLELESLTTSHQRLVAQVLACLVLGVAIFKNLAVLKHSGAVINGLPRLLKLEACQSSVGVNCQVVFLEIECISIVLLSRLVKASLDGVVSLCLEIVG